MRNYVPTTNPESDAVASFRHLQFRESGTLTRQDLPGLSDAELQALLPVNDLAEIEGAETEYSIRECRKKHRTPKRGLTMLRQKEVTS